MMYQLSEKAERRNQEIVSSKLKGKISALHKEHFYTLKNIDENVKKIESKYKNPVTEESKSERHLCSPKHAREAASKKINVLLMTNGEVDIEKVLCLHVASLSIPSLCPTSWYKLEKDTTVLTRYANYLPNYVAINSQTNKNCNCLSPYCSRKIMRNSPVQMFIMVNSQIEIILNMILNTLREVNEYKLKRLVRLARNVSSIKLLLSREKNLNFISQVYESSKTLRCYAFRTEICTVMKGSNQLINEIDKHWKNPVFKIMLPLNFPIYDPLTTNFMTDPKGCSANDPYFNLIELYKNSSDKGLTDENLSPVTQLSHSSSALTILSTEGSDITILNNLGIAIKPSSNQFIKKLSALLQYTGELSEIEKDGKHLETSESILENIFNTSNTTSMMITAPLTKTKSTMDMENKIDTIINNSKSNIVTEIQKIRRKEESDYIESKIDEMKLNILNRVSNQHRILIADEVCRRKSRDINVNGKTDSRICIGSVMGSVLTKGDLINLALLSPKHEREFLLKPVTKGGLGFASLIIGEENLIRLEKKPALASFNELTESSKFENVDNNVCNNKTLLDISITSSLDLAYMTQTITSCEIQKRFSIF